MPSHTPAAHDPEFSSQRMFMPPPPSPRKVQAYGDLLRMMGLEKAARRLVLAHLEARPQQSLLHAGCGMGGLTRAIKRRHPDLEVVGIDPDVDQLKVAAERAEAARLSIFFQKGYLQDLPSADERHDTVLCALFMYRLRGQDRGDAFAEFARALKPGGRMLMVDFGAPSGGVGGWMVRRLARHEKGLADHLAMGLEEICRLGRFEEVRKVGEDAFGLQAVLCRKA